MLKHLLHGRRDAEAITILKNCRAVIPQNGSLLIVEFILPPLVSHADPQLEGHLMSDLNMLAVTGGKERSEREWRTLLEAAEFILTRVHPVGGDTLMVRNVGILEAKPARGSAQVAPNRGQFCLAVHQIAFLTRAKVCLCTDPEVTT